MRRNKRHKIKTELNESSITSSNIVSSGQDRDFDLAHYIHDRVELLQRAFGAIKPRELRAMTPACVAGLSLDDLQELCLEELLGISSVRLCAILDGADPPSDTDSSESSEPISTVHLETISLDSISSDEDTLNPQPVTSPQESKSGKLQHKRRCRRKEARKAKPEATNDGSQSRSRTAERAGMTVLELLELQARARAIRAQLAMEQTQSTVTDMTARKGGDESDNDVEIKEEPPEVVELSSEDESQNHVIQSSACSIANDLQKDKSNINRSSSPEKAQEKSKCELTVIVPNIQSRKIKLKRNKASAPTTQELTDSQKSNIHENVFPATVQIKDIESVSNDFVKLKENEIQNDDVKKVSLDKSSYKNERPRSSRQKKKKRHKNKSGTNREGSDHDEITLQLSDTEKMDLLEDLDRKNVNNVSSSESDTSTDFGASTETPITIVTTEFGNYDNNKNTNQCNRQLKSQAQGPEHASLNNDDETSYQKSVEVVQNTKTESDDNLFSQNKDVKLRQEPLSKEETQVHVLNILNKSQETESNSNHVEGEKNNLVKGLNVYENQALVDQNEKLTQVNDISEGEISDRTTSEVKTKDIDPLVSTIDCETLTNKQEKIVVGENSKQLESNEEMMTACVDSGKQSDNDDVCEILEISDDSSCYEDEGVSVLSKEPTTEEIEAFSAKIDHEIQREELTTDKQGNTDLENISWKHRYLDSKKVKKIMSTANILNALRKKNKELKRKIEESRNNANNEGVDEINEAPSVEEGTVEQYNTLEGSTKYVATPPVSVSIDENVKHLHKEMKKDAKQLLKMYKRLLKYNDMQKETRKNKPKKKKNKKEKQKTSDEALK